MLIARGMRCTVRVSSTSCLNPSFSSMVATGNKPPYGVRFLPEKSKGVLAAILLGSDATFGEPCGTGVLRLCLELSFTIWVTPENGLAKVRTSRLLCSTTAFSGSPNGFSFHTLPRTSKLMHRSGSMQHRTLAIACLGLATILISSMAEAQYQLKNLVSNQVKQAIHTDPLLANGWGLVHGPGTPWWISDNNSGWSTLYDGFGKQVTKLKVLIPTAGNGPSSPTGKNGPGSPTGVVFNGSNDFELQGGGIAFPVCNA